MSENLWGEIRTDVVINTPYMILKEQAAMLKAATKDILQGKVIQDSDDDKFLVTFRIVAPYLGNYQYEVCMVGHDIALYPVSILDPSSQQRTRCANEQEFKQALATIFQSPRIKQVIQSLLAQSRK